MRYLVNEDGLGLYFGFQACLFWSRGVINISNYERKGSITLAALEIKSICSTGGTNKSLSLRSYQPGSGSAFRLVVTKLEGKSPTPLWFSPFHQFGSL